MKTLILISAAFLASIITTEFYAQVKAKTNYNLDVVSNIMADSLEVQHVDKNNNATNFNQALFESALITEMEQQFPMLKMDTSLLFVVKATSQKDAGYPECYVMKKGGMVNLQENELTQAHRIVKEYKRHMSEDRNFDSTTLIRCNFTEFCVTTVLQYGGLIRYGIVIDNNFKREDAIFDSKKFEAELQKLNLIVEDER